MPFHIVYFLEVKITNSYKKNTSNLKCFSFFDLLKHIIERLIKSPTNPVEKQGSYPIVNEKDVEFCFT